MSEAIEKILVILVGDIYIKGFVVTYEDGDLQIINEQQYLKTASDQDLIEAIKFEFQGQYKHVEIVNDPEKAFEGAITRFSSNNLSVAINFSGGSTLVTIGMFGRIVLTKKLPFGFSMILEELLLPEPLKQLEQWFINHAYEPEDIRNALNYLGNRQLFRGILPQTRAEKDALVGLMWLICQQININAIIADNCRGIRFDSIYTLYVSGEVLQEIHDDGSILLAIIDGLELSGIWHMYKDTRQTLPLYGLYPQDNLYSTTFDKMDSWGSLIVLNSVYPWGEYIGEMKLDIGLSEDQVIDLKSGQLVRIPLSSEVNGGVVISAKSNVEIQYNGDLNKIIGGTIGLLIDSRNRPLPPIDQANLYKKYLRHWLEAVE